MAPAVPHEKALSAIMGGFCADAATYPLHWIYDLGKVKELLQGKEAAPEFYPTPSCPFYNSGQTGVQSCYGDELIPLLKSMAENGGEFDAIKFSEAVYEFYTKTSPQSYKNKSIRTFLAAFEEGKRGVDCGDPSDSQANCFAKVPILLARYAGRPDGLQRVEEAIRTQQNNADAVKNGMAAAKILEKVMLGDSASAALVWAKDTPGVLEPEMQQLVAKAVDASKAPPADLSYQPPPFMKGAIDKLVAEKESLPVHTWAVWSHGPACSNPAALTNVLMLVSAFSGKGSSGYVDAVRANLVAAGDNASRVLYIGAVLAAEMAPKSDKSATPSRSTSVPTGVPGASYADDAHTSVLEKPSPDWDQQRIKKEVRLLKSAVAAKAASEEDGHQRNARLDSLATLHGELDSRTSQLENKAEQLESGLAEQGTRHDARFTQQDRCLRAHAQQLDIHHVTMANQLSHKQLEKLATKEDIEQLLQSGKRARSATASPPAPSSDAEDEPAPKEPPSYEELQAELAAFKANQASTSKATSDKAKGKPFNKKAKHADNNKGGRAPEGSAEEARRQAEYHRRKAQEADALLAERKK